MEGGNRVSLYRKVFETEWFSIEATLDNFSGNKPYYRLSCNDSVEILAVTPERKIILIRQFRPALGIYTLEFPSGYVDEKESSEDAIERELKEETGFVCDSVIFMGSFKIVPSRINTTLHFFFGKDAKIVEKKRKEEIEVILVSEEEFRKLIMEEKFFDVSGLAIYFIAKLKGFLTSEEGRIDGFIKQPC
jgi:8-oxo-dGTP pyrophosphatase MutT (NUDIX family)